MIKNPFFMFGIWALFLSYPAFAQETIQIDIDNAPVEVGVEQQTAPARQVEDTNKTAENETASGGKGVSGLAIAAGALAAAALAALAGGGSGGGNSTSQH